MTGSSSAFPTLPEDPDQLPGVPGGWQDDVVELGERVLRLARPADPDAFLDDAGVHAANARNDYMPYWAFLWPSAVAMARTVLARAPWPVGSRVLELGAGIGLVGLAAQCRGDAVTFSDHDRTALHLCRLNARRNQLAAPGLLELDWRQPGGEKFPVIIGCEVTYDAPSHGPLLDVLSVQLHEGGVVWLGDPGRYQAIAFHKLAKERGWEARILDESGTTHAAPLSGGFQILELRRGEQ